MLERKIIGACVRHRGAYDAFSASGNAGTLGEDLAPLFKVTTDYYTRDESADEADPDVLRGLIRARGVSPKQTQRELELLDLCLAETEGTSEENIFALLREQAMASLGMRLASAIAGGKEEGEVTAALEAYLEAREGPKATEDLLDWGEALSREVDRGHRMALSPKVLNQYIRGGLLPGHNVTIFGRPESGKTALAITMACGFARRGVRVLYVGNEDPIEDLMIRCVSNLSGLDADQIAADPEEAERLARARGVDNLRMMEMSPGSVGELHAAVKRYRPQVLFVDQLRNLFAGKTENYTRTLDANAQAVRAIGKRFHIATISVTQAGDSASGRPILDMGDVDSSNTGIPGAADLMIGVGVTEALETSGSRMLSLCKNKLGYVKATQIVTLDPFRSKMR